ncbi:hypothetical protein QM565_24245 [Geitlerinema splendidum]|nr:hypothetical protein [Geitlerinema splendidum]
MLHAGERGSLLCSQFRLGEHREEDCRQDRDDRDDDEQFDKRKCSVSIIHSSSKDQVSEDTGMVIRSYF